MEASVADKHTLFARFLLKDLRILSYFLLTLSKLNIKITNSYTYLQDRICKIEHEPHKDSLKGKSSSNPSTQRGMPIGGAAFICFMDNVMKDGHLGLQAFLRWTDEDILENWLRIPE